jgi:Arc/MetJ family transcription regulator
MRINIDIDDDLIAEAIKVTGKSTAEEALEEALLRVARTYRLRRAINRMRGMGWEGDLDEMRGGESIIHTK